MSTKKRSHISISNNNNNMKSSDDEAPVTAEIVVPDMALVWKISSCSFQGDDEANKNGCAENRRSGKETGLHADVALQDIVDSCVGDGDDNNNNSKSSQVGSGNETSTATSTTTIKCQYGDDGNNEDDDNQKPAAVEASSTTNNNEDKVPASVLQYERQMRKAQIEKRTGKKIQELQVLYVDEHIVVVNKPSGVLTVPGVNNKPSLLDAVYEKYGDKKNFNRQSMIVHRLDMDTSGLVIFGRTPDITKQLHKQFRFREVSKEYQAVVMGHVPLPLDSIHIDLPLQKDHVHPPFMRVATNQSSQAAQRAVAELNNHGWKKLVARKAKPSQTQVTILDRWYHREVPLTTVRLVPITGRTHQLRVHLAALGYPILGDPTYSLYGEAAPCGGLEDTSVWRTTMMTTTPPEPNSSTTSSTATSTQSDEHTVVVTKCPMDVQMACTQTVHPPNEKRMCLHAAYLKLQHPIHKERTLQWELAPDFFGMDNEQQE